MSLQPALGQVWRVQRVHHPAFANEIGKEVVLQQATSDPRMFWCCANRPLQTRINRLGRRVVSYDPRCSLHLYDIRSLVLAVGAVRQF